ncbi:MAG: hypothetical protein PUE13_01695 [Clostridiales bacterium]|nr:hypothetical protein [Clostridiales bacterium]
MADKCIKCGRELTRDEIGLHKKLFNRGATEFMCITCVSKHFEVSEDALRDKIDQFRKMGCQLFAENTSENFCPPN